MAGEAFDALKWGSPERIEAKRKVAAHRQRCLSLPPLERGEAELLVAKFLADGGSVRIFCLRLRGAGALICPAAGRRCRASPRMGLTRSGTFQSRIARNRSASRNGLGRNRSSGPPTRSAISASPLIRTVRIPGQRRRAAAASPRPSMPAPRCASVTSTTGASVRSAVPSAVWSYAPSTDHARPSSPPGPEAQLELEIPAHAQDDDFTVEVATFEQLLHALQLAHCRPLASLAASIADRSRCLHQSRADGGKQQCYRSSWRIGSFGSSGRVPPASIRRLTHSAITQFRA